EMGLVVMAASGTVLLDLVKDVAFCAPPVTPEKARDLLARLRVAKLLAGYRGAPAYDTDAVVDALGALGRPAGARGRGHRPGPPAGASPGCARAIAARPRTTRTPSSTRWSRSATSPP